MPKAQMISILAPAKINLYLHVTDLREDGYHELDSLVCFADIGDRIEIEPAPDFSFRIKGPFATAFTAAERNETPQSKNIAVRAAWRYAKLIGRDLPCRLTLIKNLPLAAGIGGGSSDAAAVLWGLAAFWNISPQSPQIKTLACELGADVPACLTAMPVRMTGIGEKLDPVAGLPDIPVVLVNPMQSCPTPEIFALYDRSIAEQKHPKADVSLVRPPLILGDDMADFQNLVSFLKAQRNDLEKAAIQHAPIIKEVLAALRAQPACALSRLSGSGATCFGLFASEEGAQEAAEAILREHPAWWVRTGWLNRAARY